MDADLRPLELSNRKPAEPTPTTAAERLLADVHKGQALMTLEEIARLLGVRAGVLKLIAGLDASGSASSPGGHAKTTLHAVGRVLESHYPHPADPNQRDRW